MVFGYYPFPWLIEIPFNRAKPVRWALPGFGCLGDVLVTSWKSVDFSSMEKMTHLLMDVLPRFQPLNHRVGNLFSRKEHPAEYRSHPVPAAHRIGCHAADKKAGINLP